MATNTIKVVCRFRPQNKIELASGGEPIVAFETEDTCKLDVRLAVSVGNGGQKILMLM
jgi:kinesin family protein 5